MQVSAGAAQRMLKDMMFSLWARQGCESHTDVVKLLSLISFYLPFLPLEREQIQELFSRRLMEVQREVLKSSRDVLLWNSRVLDFLTSQVRRVERVVKLDFMHLVLCYGVLSIETELP